MARPFRSGFILAVVALGAGLAAAGGWRYARASAPVNGPIILISADALRADRLPAYGYRRGRTPAVDQLAADGIVFEHAYSHDPETLPAHAALLSGRLPFDTGVRDDVGFSVKESERLLAEMLRDRGYATGGVVSTFTLRKGSGIAQGFTFFDDQMTAAGPDTAFGELSRDGRESERIAEQWLDAAGTSRAFLFLQLDEPRAPHVPDAQPADTPLYDAAVTYTDDVIGRLLRYLKAHQLYDRSTIVLSSDHGMGLGDHGEQEHGLFVYEEAVRVPLVVKQAAGEGAGRRVTDLVEHIDLVPTILDLAKAPLPGNLRGRSLKPLLDGDDGTGRFQGRMVYSESLFGRYHFGWSELTTITDGRYRYIKAPREELYDLHTDPAERVNLAPDPKQAHTVAALRAALDQLTAATPVPEPGDVTAEDHERFEALGDVGRGSDPEAATLDAPDPKDAYAVLEADRAAVDLATSRQWMKAIERLRSILRSDPNLTDIWRQLAGLAFKADRNEQAADAYAHVLLLQPSDPDAHLGAAATLFRLGRLDEARQHAELAASLARDGDRLSRSSAHEWLARIALARRDVRLAREEAELTRKMDPALPMPAYVEGRLQYDQGRYADALPFFEDAAAALAKSHGRPMASLHFYLADTLTRLERADEAESEWLAELRDSPQNTRAWTALATFYHNDGRTEEVARALDDLVRFSPTPDAYTLAARLWTSFGDRQRAADARAEALRLTASSSRSTIPSAHQ